MAKEGEGVIFHDDNPIISTKCPCILGFLLRPLYRIMGLILLKRLAEHLNRAIKLLCLHTNIVKMEHSRDRLIIVRGILYLIWRGGVQFETWHFQGPFHYYRIPSIPGLICNHIIRKVWEEITYSFSNINGLTFEIWEWINNSIPHFMIGVITYPCWDWNYSS